MADEARRTNARVWVYGYNADVAFQAAAGASSFDFAGQLLERVAHIRRGVEVRQPCGSVQTTGYGTMACHFWTAAFAIV